MNLTVDHLDCTRGGRAVIRGLGFSLAPGQAMALRGPNGVGKSTLLRVLAGFLPLRSGTVRLGEISLAKDITGFQEHVLYAGHLDAVKPALGVAENLRLWAGIYGTGEARIAAALAHFGLDRIAERPAAECSAGQKRRLGLARMMVMDRPLWLLDEPTVSLDVDAVRGVADLVRQHVATGGMALIATHVDLGLGEIAELRMTPVEDTPETEADPFLQGSWQ